MINGMICYPDGTEARVGDMVRYFEETMTVEDVVTESRLREFAVRAPGLMLVGSPFGRLFLSVGEFEDEDGSLAFVSRKA